MSDEYIKAAKRLFSRSVEAKYAENYALFTTLVLQWFEELTREAQKLHQIFSSFTALETIELLNEIIVQESIAIQKSHWAELETKVDVEGLTPIQKTEVSEWIIHNLHGKVNDIAFAGSRVLNWILPFSNSTKSVRNPNKPFSQSHEKLYIKATEALRDLIQIAGNWNSIEYSLNQVSYAEWFVEEVKTESNLTEIKFAIADIKFTRANDIGMRRYVMSSRLNIEFRGRENPRWMRQLLEPFAYNSIKKAINFYCSNSWTSHVKNKGFEQIKPIITKFLDALDIEDELLLVIAKKDFNVLAHYLAATALFCFYLTSQYVEKYRGKTSLKQLKCPVIPIETIISLVSNKNKSHLDAARRAVNSHITNLPTSGYHNIVNAPYLQLTKSQVVAFAPTFNMNWTPKVRSSVVNSGTLTQSYGQIWENYIRYVLKENEWTVLENGRKIRRDNQTLTDIDIIAFKNGLIFLIQVKAIVTAGFNRYEVWKAKNQIMHGVEQSLIVMEELEGNTNFLQSLLAVNKMSQKVEVIQPLVITNLPMFNGWKYKNIPVIGFNYLISLLNGAEVEFKNLAGTVIGKKRFAMGSKLTITEFLDYLKTPFDWDLAREGNQVEYLQINIGNIKLHFPLLKRDGSL